MVFDGLTNTLAGEDLAARVLKYQPKERAELVILTRAGFRLSVVVTALNRRCPI